MKFAYADPPYQGQASKYSREARANGRSSKEVDHDALILELVAEYPEGWALSCKSNSLRELLTLCPADVRVLAWVKPFVPAYRGVRPVYAWEPVILRGGRKASDDAVLTMDFLMCSPRMGVMPRKTTGALGAKPPEFCRWILDVLGYEDGDTLDDLFPGTGIMGAVAAQGRIAL